MRTKFNLALFPNPYPDIITKSITPFYSYCEASVLPWQSLPMQAMIFNGNCPWSTINDHVLLNGNMVIN
jgi:hypothetical protein